MDRRVFSRDGSPHITSQGLAAVYSYKYSQESECFAFAGSNLRNCTLLALSTNLQRPEARGGIAPCRDDTLGQLNYLRVIALKCRSAAHQDLSEACAMLAVNRDQARLASAEVLIRCLSQAIDERPVFFRPGTIELSFDEAWLARLMESVQANDHDSFQFLIRSRVPRWAQRNVAFLIRSVSGQATQI